ncbi:hypothetical protein H7F51_03785 [Novosphingobium flavum]|uniref:NnrU domain-containing protein n=1 Tax=Novosphingobium flavum TaxID=1778672 RepID=A0A7X1FPM4_9SPHN|nr:NnrU family protein [Novosphingobium flavum]MBC2664638.1 hypothetical protein [Novosphingobium flavum]
MEEGLLKLAAACVLFVGSHMVMSGPVRAPLVRSLGQRGFLGLYTLVAIVTFGWAILSFHRAGRGTMLWDGTALVPWLIASALTLFAMVLLVGSLSGNPALPDANLAGLSARKPWGIFQVTRHPMMMGIAFWAVAHMLVSPTARTALFDLSLGLLALAGAAAQDRRKLARNSREWGVWMARTSFWPRPRGLSRIGNLWAAGLLAWLAATAAHMWLGGIPAGIWIVLS